MKFRSIVSALVTLAVPAMAHADAATTPLTKNAAYATISGLTINTSVTPVTTLQIAKGKKKRVLEVDIAITEPGTLVGAFSSRANVNGIALEPTDFLVTHCNVAVNGCSHTNRFWADLDALEAANPGLIIGQPLNIGIEGITGGGNTTATVTARARLVAK